MKNYQVVTLGFINLNHLDFFQDAYYNSKLIYSLQDLSFDENPLPIDIINALQKSIQICQLSGIQSEHHFKKIFVYDTETKSIRVDWKMSQNGYNLMIMQLPFLNEKIANRLWFLANI